MKKGAHRIGLVHLPHPGWRIHAVANSGSNRFLFRRTGSNLGWRVPVTTPNWKPEQFWYLFSLFCNFERIHGFLPHSLRISIYKKTHNHNCLISLKLAKKCLISVRIFCALTYFTWISPLLSAAHLKWLTVANLLPIKWAVKAYNPVDAIIGANRHIFNGA